MFTKLLKVLVSLLRRLNTRLIIFLDEILHDGVKQRAAFDVLMARDTVVFLRKHLGFVINAKKSVFQPLKNLQFIVGFDIILKIGIAMHNPQMLM